jgi:hypothetical protein
MPGRPGKIDKGISTSLADNGSGVVMGHTGGLVKDEIELEMSKKRKSDADSS